MQGWKRGANVWDLPTWSRWKTSAFTGGTTKKQACGVYLLLRAPFLDPINQLMLRRFIRLFQLRRASFWHFSPPSVYNPNDKWKCVAIWCGLNTRPTAVSLRERGRERQRRRKWRNLRANGNHESHNLSSSPAAQRAPSRWGGGGGGGSLGGPHQRACTKLIRVRLSSNPPPSPSSRAIIRRPTRRHATGWLNGWQIEERKYPACWGGICVSRCGGCDPATPAHGSHSSGWADGTWSAALLSGWEQTTDCTRHLEETFDPTHSKNSQNDHVIFTVLFLWAVLVGKALKNKQNKSHKSNFLAP